eukprot:CAMPEP_0177691772 /NCGR_PEP_ID=MMETSP0484_2-20121128/1492_1 /TAXON_ID=354590 /ORGANISM="Rhodomonas lens, Strain RHODO" /LENGTH=183 /DNA_ID=CAMNT_0019202433 /DNA_START=133 /DNA_END=684 /DNA_ORIENTATION=+
MGSTVSCEEGGGCDDLCSPSRPSPRDRVDTAAQVSTSTFELGDAATPYGVGLLWLVRNDKLIVAGFGKGSDGPRAGVRMGDILAQIDGNMVLDLKSVNGKHPAQDMMVGTRNTVCEIKLLRVHESEKAMQRRSSFNSGGSPAVTPPSSNDISDDVKLKEVTCIVKRLVPMNGVGITSPHMAST